MTEKMKPSGIEWIGDIPESWDVGRVKDYYALQTGFTPDTSVSEYYDDENGYLWVSIADINEDKIINDTKSKISSLYVREKHPASSPAGSLLYSFKLSVGKVAFLEKEMFTNEAIASFANSPNICLAFLYYSSIFIEENANRNIYGAKILNQDLIKNAHIVFPPLMEQRAIADFLDAQCAKIDSVIGDIEKQIETLQKYKKSLITEAVTKGLDRSVPMMDSGIEWIGKIPAHWGTNRLRYVASVKTGPFGTQLSADEYVDEGVPIINVKNIGYGSILAEDLDFVPESVADRLSVHRLKLDDIIFGRKGSVDKHAIITDEYVNWVQGSDCIRVRSNPEINSGYLNYLFDSTYFGSYVMLYAVGATMPSMSSDILLNARILVPPVQEQKEIAAYLNKQCGKINAIITNKQEQLATIRRHKNSLIYEYVTGKKRVTEVN